MNGFISLHRKVIEWEWYTDPDTFRVFIHLLMMANYAPAKVRGRDVARGQHITSTVRLVDTLNISFSRVRKALTRLREGGEIIIENPSNRFSLVTIVKYDSYQLTPDDLVTLKSSKTETEDIQTATNNKNNNNNKDNKVVGLNVHDWKINYLKNKRLINAVCKNQGIGKDDFDKEIESFVIHRMNSSSTTDTEVNFNTHLRNFIRKRQLMKTEDGLIKSDYSKQAF